MPWTDQAALAAASWNTGTVLPLTGWTGTAGCSEVGYALGCNAGGGNEPPNTPSTSATQVFFLDGFENDAATLAQLWTINNSANVSITTANRGGVTAGKSVRFINTGAAIPSIEKTFSPWPQHLYIRMYFRYTSVTYGNAEQFLLSSTDGGAGGFSIRPFFDTGSGGTIKLRLYIGAALVYSFTTSLTPGTWYRLETHWNVVNAASAAPEEAEAKLFLGDNTSSLEESGVKSQDRNVGYLTFRVGDQISSATRYTLDVDDMCVLYDAYPGPGGVWLIYPSGDSAAGWTPDSGTNNFSRVDDLATGAHDSDTSYISTLTTNATDLYNIGFSSSSAPGTGTIKRAECNFVSRWPVAAGADPFIKALIRTPDLTVWASTGVSMSGVGTYTPFHTYASRHLFLSWTNGIPIAFNSQFKLGIKETAAITSAPRATAVWGNMDIK